jgi:Chalcone isomerase-like
MPVLHITFRLITRTLLFALLIVQPMNAAALTVEGVTFQESVSIANKQVPIRGVALLRWLNIFKVYVAALYLPENGAPDDVLADIPKRLEISYLVSIPGPDFGKGAEAILERNNSPDALARLRGRIDQLNAVYRDVKPGDRYALTYVPGQGTELSYNGQPLITIEGADFAAAYFGIWLGNDPIDQEMRSRLINGG